jgi:hypothetical protein
MKEEIFINEKKIFEGSQYISLLYNVINLVKNTLMKAVILHTYSQADEKSLIFGRTFSDADRDAIWWSV